MRQFLGVLAQKIQRALAPICRVIKKYYRENIAFQLLFYINCTLLDILCQVKITKNCVFSKKYINREKG